MLNVLRKKKMLHLFSNLSFHIKCISNYFVHFLIFFLFADNRPLFTEKHILSLNKNDPIIQPQ